MERRGRTGNADRGNDLMFEQNIWEEVEDSGEENRKTQGGPLEDLEKDVEDKGKKVSVQTCYSGGYREEDRESWWQAK
jgi:hypothetical protein